MTLYLAKKDGAWLKHDHDVEKLLRGNIDTEYEKMLSSWTLDDEDYFGDDFLPGRKEIHVLVELPPPPQAASIKEQLRYKGMSTEASCRKFLDALAQKLAVLYDFDYNYGIPTIGDVF